MYAARRRADVEAVGQDTVAIEFETPAGFEGESGQFVSVQATVDGVEAAGYYTISSPRVSDVSDVLASVTDAGVDQEAAHIESFGPK